MFELIPFNGRRGGAVYNPFKELDEIEKSLFKNGNISEFKTDIRDEGESFLLEADLPGFKKEDIKISLDKDYLTITATRHAVKDDKDKKNGYIRCERAYGSFSRSFDVSEVKIDEISASYEDGVLKLVLPKKGEEVPATKSIEIK